MCKIQTLARENESRVYIYLSDENIALRFLVDAEREGFTFIDGTKPTERPADCLYAVNRDFTINYVGFAGHMAFGCAKQIGDKSLVKVDYKDFLEQSK